MVAISLLHNWGNPGVPLLPASLRRLWADEQLPAWFADELGLPAAATYGALDSVGSLKFSALSQRGRKLLAFLVTTRRSAIEDTVVFDAPLPDGFVWDNVPWKTRTLNAIKNGMWNHQLPWGLQDIRALRFSDLLGIPSLGAIGILDFSCTLEAAVVAHSTVPVIREATDQSAGDNGVRPDRDLAWLSSQIAQAVDAAREPWAEQVSERDPRFRDVMPSGRGTIAERVDTAIAAANGGDTTKLSQLIDQLPLIRSRVSEFADAPLDDSLRELVTALTGYKGDRNSALLARLHWGGDAEGRTLEWSAAGLGITRERMRQLQVKVESKLPLHAIYLPALDRALRFLEKSAPIDAEKAAAAVQNGRIANSYFHPASVLAAAKRLGHSHALVIKKLTGSYVVIAEPEAHASARTIAIANRQTYGAGATSVPAVLEALKDEGVTSTQAAVRSVLDTCGEYRFLEGDWFGMPNRRVDFVQKNTRKMLSLVSELDIGTLRDGLGRAFRFRAASHPSLNWPPVPPPRSVLIEYFRSHSDFVINPDARVRSAVVLSTSTDLTPSEKVLSDVLRSSPLGVMDRQSLAEGCEARGVSPATTWAFCSYSPIIAQITHGVWSIRGMRVDPTSVAELLRANSLRPREPRVLDHAWTQDGRLWVASRLPRFQEALIISIPAAIRRYLSGRSFSHASTGDSINVNDDGIVVGYKGFLRSTGADEGDVLIMTFDLLAGTVALEVDTGERLDESDIA